jgi:hypothetical protein
MASAETMVEDWVEVQEFAIRPKSTEKPAPLDIDLYKLLNFQANETLSQHESVVCVADLDPTQLYPHFLKSLPESMRQTYNCSTCQNFTRRYGALCVVDDMGELQPLMWKLNSLEKSNEDLVSAFEAAARLFIRCKVRTQFKVTQVESDMMKIRAKMGGYDHLHLEFPKTRISKDNTNPSFAPTSPDELAVMLTQVIEKYQLSTITRATQALEQHKLPQPENHTAAARWLLKLLTDDKLRLKHSDKTAQANLIYRYAAGSFIGCINQLKNGVLSTLLDDLEMNKPWRQIEAAWTLRINPSQYLRPQAATTAGNIKASETLFKNLGITESDLRRRFMIHNDIPKECIMWQSRSSQARIEAQTQPTATSTSQPDNKGLFDKLIPKNRPRSGPSPQSQSNSAQNLPDLPPTRITFTSFVNTVLPNTIKLECKLSTHDGLYFLIEGYPNTKPLMQWHSETNNNRASWYVYASPNAVETHNLKPKEWNEVGSILPFPHLWDSVPLTSTLPLPTTITTSTSAPSNTTPATITTPPSSTTTLIPDDKAPVPPTPKLKPYHTNHGFRYLLTFPDITDPNSKHLMLFPTLLKSEFHGARATIEAFSNSGSKEVRYGADGKGEYVGGVAVSKGMGMGSSSGGEEKFLFRTTEKHGGGGVWDVVLFE